MRTFLVGFLLVLCPIICYPIHFIMWLRGKKDITKRWSMGKKVAGWFFKLELKAAGVKVKVIGEENIPDTPALFVGNHRSYLDILVHHNVIKAPVGFVAKIELAKNILIAPYMKDIGCLFLDRNDIKQGMETIKQGAEYLKLGHSMVLFPEGARNQKETMLPFKEGGYKMAEKAGVPIVPMAIIGSEFILESAPGKGVHRGDITVVYGKPFNPSDFSMKERKAKYQELPDIIQGLIDANK
ncbi:MAG: 1-acyl-sn-glycerol-3-phosphate acyltransferase [Lachnospiraceae bacterium]|nr:1-acyl-sn-glycerol-3-phosphate acyltransferase [Lachnospiraceae bacterium]